MCLRDSLNASQLDARHEVFASEAARLAGEPSVWSDVALLKIAGRKSASPENKASAAKALDEGWAIARRRVQIMKAAGIAGDASRAAQFVAALEDADADVAAAARTAGKQLTLDPAHFAAPATDTQVGAPPL